jgi:hypothetical protein
MRSWILLFVLSCGGRRSPGFTVPDVDLETLFVQEVPTTTARLDYRNGDHHYVGPARIEMKGDKAPFELELEEFDEAQTLTLRVVSTDPVAFAPAAGNDHTDSGSYMRDHDRLLLNVDRSWPSGDEAKIVVVADLLAEAKPPPPDWLGTGTTLYYGRAFDSKPITLVVPMALTVRLGAASDGSRVLTWKADLDPATQAIITGELTVFGRRFIAAPVVEAGQIHSDVFDRGEDIADAGSLFTSRSTMRNLLKFGGAAWHDKELSGPSVLVKVAETEVILQADDSLWRIPAVVAAADGGRAVYVIAADEDDPVILSASRPGYKMKLMAIGRPE